MQISINRGGEIAEYKVGDENKTLLDMLSSIKTSQDTTLCYSSGCRSGICGSCAVRVEGREVLACSYKPSDGDVVEPLKNSAVIRDLVVDMDEVYKFNAKAKAYLSVYKDVSITHQEQKINELQSDCILCASCYSACPVYEVNKEFLGPFALTRVWRYVSDKREQNPNDKIDNIQTNGIWDCTLCNACTIVCPQGISSKADIEKLRAKSALLGYMDPNFASFGFGGGFDGSPIF